MRTSWPRLRFPCPGRGVVRGDQAAEEQRGREADQVRRGRRIGGQERSTEGRRLRARAAAQGPGGRPRPAGAQATKLWAQISAGANPTVLASSGNVTVTRSANLAANVTFPSNVSKCSIQLTRRRGDARALHPCHQPADGIHGRRLDHQCRWNGQRHDDARSRSTSRCSAERVARDGGAATRRRLPPTPWSARRGFLKKRAYTGRFVREPPAGCRHPCGRGTTGRRRVAREPAIARQMIACVNRADDEGLAALMADDVTCFPVRRPARAAFPAGASSFCTMHAAGPRLSTSTRWTSSQYLDVGDYVVITRPNRCPRPRQRRGAVERRCVA